MTDFEFGASPQQQCRMAALSAAVCLVATGRFADDLTLRDIEQMAVGSADRLTEWIDTGSYDWGPM